MWEQLQLPDSYCFISFWFSYIHQFNKVDFAKSVSRILNIAIHIKIPNSIGHIMQQWRSYQDANTKCKILVGVAAMFWSIWLYRNDIIFNKKPITSLCRQYSVERIGSDSGSYRKSRWKRTISREPSMLSKWWLWRSRQRMDSSFSLDYVNNTTTEIFTEMGKKN